VVALVSAPVAAPAEPSRGGADDRAQVAVVTPNGIEERHVTEAELAALRTRPGAVVARGRTVAPQLAQSVPRVGAPAQWALGHRGAGSTIAVIDTGVAADFGGAVTGQACFAASQTATDLLGHCGQSRDVTEAFDGVCFDLGVCGVGDTLDPDAARPCDEPAQPQDCAHGTAVAAVAARYEPTPGVAPDAGVYAIQVFEPTGRTADFVDILLALDHVIDLVDAGLEIRAVNLSLASPGTFQSACDSGISPDPDALAFRSAFQQLEARGIPSIVATGNDGAVGGIGMPACVSNAVAVTASDLDDQIADFSNRGRTVDLAAPGADEGNGSIDPMDVPGSPVTQWAGTSFAAPHVAGGFVLLQQEYPLATPALLLSHLRATAVPASDADGGVSYPRLRMLPPAQALPAGVLFPGSAPVAGTARGATGDFDGDGFGDVLAHGPGGAPDRIAYGRARWSPVNRSYTVGGSYLPLVGNFRGSAADDVLWYAPGPGADWLWVGSPSRSFTTAALTVNQSYAPIVADFDGDGFDDILWYGPGRAFDILWYGGATGFTPSSTTINGTYRTVAGDVDGDGGDDVVFHGTGSGSDWLWRGRPTRGAWAVSTMVIGGSKTLRTGDVNGDGADDLLLYEAGPASDSIWRGGAAVGSGGPTAGFSPLAISVNGTYQPSVADLDGDDRADILWYAAGSAGDYVWFGRSAGAPASRGISVLGQYVPLTADLDATAGDDIVWFQANAPTTPVWFSHPG
jgi:hypothetical protein